MSRPTAAALVEELRQHMRLLRDDPVPVAKASDHFLTHWLLILDWIAALVESPRSGHPDACPYCGRQGNGEPCAPYCGATEE